MRDEERVLLRETAQAVITLLRRFVDDETRLAMGANLTLPRLTEALAKVGDLDKGTGSSRR